MIKSEIGVEIYVNLMSSRCKCLTQFVQLRWRGVMLSGGVAWCCSGGENRRSGVGTWSGGLPTIGLTSPSASIEIEKNNNFSAISHPTNQSIQLTKHRAWKKILPGTAVTSAFLTKQLPMCRVLMKPRDWFDRKFVVGEGTPQDPELGGERKFEEGGGLSLATTCKLSYCCSTSESMAHREPSKGWRSLLCTRLPPAPPWGVQCTLNIVHIVGRKGGRGNSGVSCYLQRFLCCGLCL